MRNQHCLITSSIGTRSTSTWSQLNDARSSEHDEEETAVNNTEQLLSVVEDNDNHNDNHNGMNNGTRHDNNYDNNNANDNATTEYNGSKGNHLFDDKDVNDDVNDDVNEYGDEYIMSFQQFWNESMMHNHYSTQTNQHNTGTHHTHTPPPEHQWLRGKKLNTSSNSIINNMNTIPNIINKIYIDKSGMFPSIQEMNRLGQGSLTKAHKSWSIHNPNYKIRYFNLNSCRQYIMEHFHPIFLRAFDCIEPFAGKVDLFRMLVVYAEGGWYSDWKQECIQDQLLDKLGKDVDFYGAWDHGHGGLAQDKCLQNCFFGAIPRHPLIATMIHMILANVQSEHYEKHALFSTATCLFGRAYRKYIDEQNQEAKRIKLGYYKDGYIRNSIEPFGYENYVHHKCNSCGDGQDWDKGNNYNHLWEKTEFYCEDAKSLFGTAVAKVKNDALLL